MNLEALRARLKAIVGELDAILKLEKPTEADEAKAVELEAEAAKLEKSVKALEQAEQTRARLLGQPAQIPPAATQRTVPAVPGIADLKPIDKMGLIAVASIHCVKSLRSGMPRTIPQILEENGFGPVADEYNAGYEAARQRTLNSAGATAGGVLLPDTMSTNLIDLLRPVTTFFQGNPENVQLVGGSYKQPKAASGAVAGYRGETKPIRVSEPTFKAIQMTAKLLGVIVPLSDQVLRWSLINIRQWVENDMRAAMAQATDVNMYFGAGTVYSPLGIFNQPGILTIDAASLGFVDPTKPTVFEIEAAATRLELARTTVNLPPIRLRWLMDPRTLAYLRDLRGLNMEQRIFPELQGPNPVWRGKPVLESTNFPSNGGVTTDEATLALVDFGYVLYGESLGMQFATSDQATIVVSPGNTINTFQDGVVAIKVEAEHDVDLRFPEAVGVLEGIRWGAP